MNSVMGGNGMNCVYSKLRSCESGWNAELDSLKAKVKRKAKRSLTHKIRCRQKTDLGRSLEK